MTSRKRSRTPSPAATESAKKQRNDRASRRAAARDVREQARPNGIAECNTINSPLLRLPGEIRNMIYAYVFNHMRFIFLEQAYYRHRGGIGLIVTGNYRDLRLPLVCRQIHQETALLPYKMGAFDFYMCDSTEDKWWNYIRLILRNRSQAQLAAIGKMMVASPEGGEVEESATYWIKSRWLV